VVLAEGATLLSFDCSGSGVSDGDYVTLGWYEKDDLAAVITHLRETEMVSTIALWGRSMGAATALLHAHRDPTIAGMILDSPFADLRQLAEEIVEMGKSQTGYRVPGFVIGGAIRLVRSSVMKKTGMDIFNLRPIADVDKSFVPAVSNSQSMFLASF
jgi:pimeloyl-ACP methyl ester carboxylesterase